MMITQRYVDHNLPPQSTECNTFTLPYIYHHTTWYIRMMKHVEASYTWWILMCIGWLSLGSRIQTQHDLKSPVYQSFIVPLLLECLKYKLGMPMSQGNIWNLLPSFPNARAGGRHLQLQAVWPLLLFSTSVSSAFTPCGRLCQLAVSLPGAAMCSVSAGCILVGPRDPPGTQHAWSFTGSNKPTLVSKEVFASNKPAYDILNHSK